MGDKRWAGAYGVAADFIASSHCSVEFITKEAIKVNEPAAQLVSTTPLDL